MRLLGIESDNAVTQTQLYLITKEANQLIKGLPSLLADSEAAEHCHIFSDDGACKISYSLITPTETRERF
jgi:hypothetical protein